MRRAVTMASTWISKTPGVCGGSACIRDTRIPIWGLVERERLGQSDAHILDNVPGLTADDLAAARAYYAEHPCEIELSLWQNDTVMVPAEDRAGIAHDVADGRRL